LVPPHYERSLGAITPEEGESYLLTPITGISINCRVIETSSRDTGESLWYSASGGAGALFLNHSLLLTASGFEQRAAV